MDELTDLIFQAQQVLKQADAVVIMAGAGVSVDSGLPDFRGDNGFWNAYPAAEKLGLSFADIASPETFRTNPRLAWAFYGHRLSLYRETKPHDGYRLLLELCSSKPGGYFVFTSNVDGHFEKIGFDKQRIVECHGSIHHLQCVEPCDEHIWNASHANIEINTDFQAQGELPKCPLCGDVARPNILMFNDNTWVNEKAEQQKMAMYYWWQEVLKEKLKVAIIEVGAGDSIKTVRYQSEIYSNYENTSLIRINPFECDIVGDGIGISMKASDALKAIIT